MSSSSTDDCLHIINALCEHQFCTHFFRTIHSLYVARQVSAHFQHSPLFAFRSHGKFAMFQNPGDFFFESCWCRDRPLVDLTLVIGHWSMVISQGLNNLPHHPRVSKCPPPHHHAIQIADFCDGVGCRHDVAIADDGHGDFSLEFVDGIPIRRAAEFIMVTAAVDCESLSARFHQTFAERNQRIDAFPSETRLHAHGNLHSLHRCMDELCRKFRIADQRRAMTRGNDLCCGTTHVDVDAVRPKLLDHLRSTEEMLRIFAKHLHDERSLQRGIEIEQFHRLLRAVVDGIGAQKLRVHDHFGCDPFDELSVRRIRHARHRGKCDNGPGGGLPGEHDETIVIVYDCYIVTLLYCSQASPTDFSSKQYSNITI